MLCKLTAKEHCACVRHRDHPEKRLDLTIARKREIVHIPVTPSLAADGGGRIGVTLASNASIARRAAKGPAQALRMAGAEFGRLAGIVTGGARPQRASLLCSWPFACLPQKELYCSIAGQSPA